MSAVVRLLVLAAVIGGFYYVIDQDEQSKKAALEKARARETAANVGCHAALQQPANGMMLSTAQRSGKHVLTINNDPGADAIIKLKDREQNTVLSMYVRAGQSATTYVPEGTWQFQYATGLEYSPDCGRFLKNMHASKDPQYTAYETTVQGNYIYTSEMTYTLQRVANGNFSPVGMSNQAF